MEEQLKLMKQLKELDPALKNKRAMSGLNKASSSTAASSGTKKIASASGSLWNSAAGAKDDGLRRYGDTVMSRLNA